MHLKRKQIKQIRSNAWKVLYQGFLFTHSSKCQSPAWSPPVVVLSMRCYFFYFYCDQVIAFDENEWVFYLTIQRRTRRNALADGNGMENNSWIRFVYFYPWNEEMRTFLSDLIKPIPIFGEQTCHRNPYVNNTKIIYLPSCQDASLSKGTAPNTYCNTFW